MTVSTTTNRGSHDGDGVTQTFPYTARIFEGTDLEVYVDGARQTLNVDYTVTGAGDPGGGNIVFGTAPPAGEGNVVWVRRVPATQEVDLPTNGPMPAGTLDEVHDRLTILVQQVEDANERALRQPESDPVSIGRLPAKADRAGKYLGFDPTTGDPVVIDGTPGAIDVSGRQVIADGSSVARALAARFADLVSVEDYGAEAGEDISAAIEAALDAGVTCLFLPAKTYYLTEPVTITQDRVQIVSHGGVLKLYDTGSLVIGTEAESADYVELLGLRFQTDTNWSGTEVVWARNCNRAIIRGCEWRFTKGDCIKTGGTAVSARSLMVEHCQSTIASGGGSFIESTVPASQRGSIIIKGGRYSGEQGGSQYAINHSGAGHLDGVIVSGAFFSDYAGVLQIDIDGSGAKAGNISFFSTLVDQVNQSAFTFDTVNGATIGRLAIVGNQINGYVGSTVKTAALVDLGGATFDEPVLIEGNLLCEANRGCLDMSNAAAFSSLVIKGNVFYDYPRDNNADGYAIHAAGTFDCLEISGNVFATTRSRDNDLQFGTVTAGRLKVEGNIVAGDPPDDSMASNYSYLTGVFAQVTFDGSGDTGSKIPSRNTVKGLTVSKSGTGTYVITFPHAYGSDTAHIEVDADACYGSAASRTSTTATIETYELGGTSLADSAQITVTFSRATA